MLLDDPALLALPPAVGLNALAIGGTVRVSHAGNGSTVAVPIVRVGRGQRPLSPAQLTARRMDDGAIALSWVRRSRAGYDWADSVDAPDDEAAEQYRLTMWQGVNTPGTTIPGAVSVDVAAAAHVIDAAAIAAWAATGAALTIRVTRIGAYGESAAATLTIPLV